MNKYQEALNDMYAVLNDSNRWCERKSLLQELVDKETPRKPTFDEVAKAWKELNLYSKKYNERIQIFSHSFGKILDIGAGENKVQIYKNEFSQFVHYDFFKAINLTIRYLESQKEKLNDK